MYIILKGLLDKIFALSLLLISFPILFLSIFLLFIELREFPFFVQDRPGFKGNIFSIYKLKTMKSVLDSKGALLPDHKRISIIGGVLRKLSIDELPQLINILKGEMSFIGPRPLLPAYLKLYNENQSKRHNVKPGITGWAQVNGRNAISWSEKFNFDIWYVNNISFLLDIKIIFLTIQKVFIFKEVNKSDKITMEPFNGTN
jgi:undecaprenyl phosphate N,N'-diacetylbacillosamine 1-phosphate transferase